MRAYCSTISDFSLQTSDVKLQTSKPLLLKNLNLEQLRPQLPRDEQAIACRVICYAVQDAALAFGDRTFGWRQEPAQIDVTDHLAAVRRDADDEVGLPDVGEHFPFHVLQLVQIHDRGAGGGHGNATLLDEG